MACKNHPDRESVAICVVCQTEVCDECRTVVDGKSYCAADAPPAVASAPPPPPPPPTGPATAPSMPPPPLGGAAAPGAPGGGTDDRSQENPVLALFCYILLCWIAGVIILATDMKKSRYMRFHAWHSIFISVGLIVIYVALAIVQIALAALHLGPLAGVIGLLMPCASVALIVFLIIMAIKAYNKQDVYNIPVITDMARQQADKMRV